MSRMWNSEVPADFEGKAFTLIEIVVALTIAAVIAAVAIPTVKGLGRDEAARAPMKALAAVVQEARLRAMREHRSYQIVFEHEGIHASPAMYPYEKRGFSQAPRRNADAAPDRTDSARGDAAD